MGLQVVAENKSSIEIFLSNRRIGVETIEKINIQATVSTSVFPVTARERKHKVFPKLPQKAFYRRHSLAETFNTSFRRKYNFSSIFIFYTDCVITIRIRIKYDQLRKNILKIILFLVIFREIEICITAWIPERNNIC